MLSDDQAIEHARKLVETRNDDHIRPEYGAKLITQELLDYVLVWTVAIWMDETITDTSLFLEHYAPIYREAFQRPDMGEHCQAISARNAVIGQRLRETT